MQKVIDENKSMSIVYIIDPSGMVMPLTIVLEEVGSMASKEGSGQQNNCLLMKESLRVG